MTKKLEKEITEKEYDDAVFGIIKLIEQKIRMNLELLRSFECQYYDKERQKKYNDTLLKYYRSKNKLWYDVVKLKRIGFE